MRASYGELKTNRRNKKMIKMEMAEESIGRDWKMAYNQKQMRSTYNSFSPSFSLSLSLFPFPSLPISFVRFTRKKVLNAKWNVSHRRSMLSVNESSFRDSLSFSFSRFSFARQISLSYIDSTEIIARTRTLNKRHSVGIVGVDNSKTTRDPDNIATFNVNR